MFSLSGDMAAGGEDATEERGRDMEIYSPGGGYGRGGNPGDRNLRRPPLEHFHTIYCDKSNYVPVFGGGVMSMGTGLEAVVVSG